MRTTFKKTPKHIGLLILIFLLISAGLYFLVVRPIIIHKEKQRFEDTARQLEVIGSQIQDKIGKADEVKTNKSCGQARVGYQKGPLMCRVSYTLTYANIDKQNANLLLGQAKSYGEGSLRFGWTNMTEYNFRTPTNEYDVQRFFQNYPSIKKATCNLAYDYVFTKKNRPDFILDLSCSAPSNNKHYSLTE